MEFSKEEQKFAQMNIKYFGLEKQVEFRIENAENLDFEDESFDIIFSVNTIHHLINPFRVMDELARIIAFEGKIILSDFTKEGLEIVDKVHAIEDRIHEVSSVDLASIDDYLSKKDFKLERYKSKCQEILIAYHPII